MDRMPRRSLLEKLLSTAIRHSDRKHAISTSRFAQEWSVALGLPPHFIELLILIEDKRFCEHMGIDVIGMVRAIRHNLRGARCRQGASTLSQQLYNIRCELKSGKAYRRTVRNKVRQIAFGIWITAELQKSEIIAEYVDTVYWGRRMYGLKAAARYYFGKHPLTLKIEESFFLIERLASPNRMRRTRLEALTARVVIQQSLEHYGSSLEDVYCLYEALGLFSND